MSDDMISVLAKQSDELVKQDEVIARLRALNAELVAALKGVVRVADRATVEFDAARAAIAKAERENTDVRT